MDRVTNTRPILVTGSHRAGTTWVGRMITQFPYTYYLGELFNSNNLTILNKGLIKCDYLYVTKESGDSLVEPLHRIFRLDFNWQNRKGIRRLLPSRLLMYRYTREWLGLPRPIMKDPIAAMAAEWLAETFGMNVILLIRHPAAFVASLKRMNWRFGFSSFKNQPQLIEDWLHPFTDQLDNPPADIVGEGALVWTCIYYVLTSYAARNPEWLIWRLEDISKNPLDAFETIYKELDIPYTILTRRRIAKYSSPTNPAGAPMNDPHSIRRNSITAQKLWRTVLTDDEVKMIRRIAEPVAGQYYSDEDWF